MGLWGTGSTGSNTEDKPKHLTTAEKREVFATKSGWTRRVGIHSGQGKASDQTTASWAAVQDEVLVAIGNLSETVTAEGVGLGVATISSMNWNTTTISKAAGATLDFTINYNEEVTVTGFPTLSVSGTGGRNHVCSMIAGVVNEHGSGTNRLRFTRVVGANSGTWNANDVLQIEANKLQHNSSTIVDAVGGATAEITHAAQLATMGSLTVAA